MVEQGIIDKLLALLNMTEKHGCTESEANLAMERAQALLLKHNLSRADIQVKEGKPLMPGIGKVDYQETNKAEYHWRRHLADIIAKNNLCDVIGHPYSQSWSILGTYDNVKASLELYHWLSEQLCLRMVKDLKTYKKSGGDENAHSWKQGFYMGACDTLNSRLGKPLRDFTQGDGSSIVVYNDKALSDAVEKVYPHLVSHVVSSGGYAGRAAGRVAGSSVLLARQRTLTGRLSLGQG